MATFEPDLALFRAQVESLRAQTDERWVCVVSDDASAPEHFERIRAELGDDPRFLLSRSEERLGFYRNFERALALAPAEAELIALCDQDDRWHPDKLAVLRAALGGAGARLLRPAARRRRRPRAARHAVAGARATTTPTSSRCSSPTRSPAPRC